MARDWYTADDLAELNKLKPCPPWMRMNPTGWCVEKWWAGGPFMAAMAVVGGALGLGMISLLVVHASKVEILKPVAKLVAKVKPELASANRRHTRRLRKHRR